MRFSIAVGAAVLLLPSSVIAFDSKCYDALGEECEAGPAAARNAWRGELDEHRQILEASLNAAGLSAADLPKTITQFGGSGSAGNTSFDSFAPIEFADVTKVHERQVNPDEFAQLPDFGYSLWDWASGFEDCPPNLPQANGEPCYDFKLHMGPLNSNHFLPQAQQWYVHYHGLALARADECAAMEDDMGQHASRFASYLRECETEALVLESLGQHFLQDAFSSGHMWERWGSATLSDFPAYPNAVVVAAVTGIFHGVRSVAAPAEATLAVDEVNDAMCAPHPEVKAVFMSGDAAPENVVGDLYLSELTGQMYTPQWQRLISCAVAGLRSVYMAAGQQHGPILEPSPVAAYSVDPLSDDCFGQRVTNSALMKGAGIDVRLGDGTELFISLVDLAALLTIVDLTPSLPEASYTAIQVPLAIDLLGTWMTLSYHSVTDPNGTNMASGGLPPLLDTLPNSNYAVSGVPADYADPILPWSPTGSFEQVALTTAFNQAHAREWCSAVGAGDSYDLNLLRERIDTLSDGDEKDVACSLCTSFAQRNLRSGTGPNDYDQSLPALCELLDASAPIYYDDNEGIDAWCNCVPGGEEPETFDSSASAEIDLDRNDSVKDCDDSTSVANEGVGCGAMLFQPGNPEGGVTVNASASASPTGGSIEMSAQGRYARVDFEVEISGSVTIRRLWSGGMTATLGVSAPQRFADGLQHRIDYSVSLSIASGSEAARADAAGDWAQEAWLPDTGGLGTQLGGGGGGISVQVVVPHGVEDLRVSWDLGVSASLSMAEDSALVSGGWSVSVSHP